MMLHGTYENGKVKFVEKKLPKVKAKFIIQIDNVNKAVKYKNLKAIWKNRDINDSVDYVKKIRKSIEDRKL